MKILILINGMGIGGAETHVLTLASALIRGGDAVDVMCAGGAYTEALKCAGAGVYIAPFKDRTLRSVLKSIRALRRRKTQRYDVIHAHTRYTAALANFCLPRIPLVTTVHLNFSLSPIKRALSCWGQKALAVSEDLATYLTDAYGIRPADILPTKNAIDTEKFPPIPARGKDILHVSRLDKDRSKSAHLLCAIAPALYKRYPDRSIRIIGDGNDFEALKDAAERANRQCGKAFVLPMGSTCAVSEVLGEGALLIGVSRAVLEGASRAIPTILSGNDGYGGILTEARYEAHKRDNFCCRGCEEATADKLYSDVCYLLDHACFCENLRHSVAARVRRDFSPESMAEDAKKAYLGALRIGVIGYYGFGNFGDEAMLLAIQRGLRERGIRNILPLYKNGEPPCLSRARPLRALLALRRCDYVLFGGGNLLQNQTSAFSFFYYAAWILLCRKDTLIGIGMGIGELNGEFFEKICGKLLGRFRSLSMRTQADAGYALRLAPALYSAIRIGCDPCLFLPQSHGSARRRKIVAIPKGAPDRAMLRFLKRKITEGYEVLPLILFPAKDLAGAEKIAALCGTPAIVADSPEDFFKACHDTALCITERLHGAVFALLAHTPCLIFADSAKNVAFAKDVENAAVHSDSPSPVRCYSDADEAEKKEREAEGKSFSFSEIISFLTKRSNY